MSVLALFMALNVVSFLVGLAFGLMIGGRRDVSA